MDCLVGTMAGILGLDVPLQQYMDADLYAAACRCPWYSNAWGGGYRLIYGVETLPG